MFALDGADEGAVEVMGWAWRPIAKMKVLRIISERGAMSSGGGRSGWQRGWVMGDIEIGRDANGELPQERREGALGVDGQPLRPKDASCKSRKLLARTRDPPAR